MLGELHAMLRHPVHPVPPEVEAWTAPTQRHLSAAPPPPRPYGCGELAAALWADPHP